MTTTYPQKITFGEMRVSGTHDILIYCRDNRCGHRVETSADGCPDHVRLSDIEPNFTCTRCGKSEEPDLDRTPTGTTAGLVN
jgi:hypothetical protein